MWNVSKARLPEEPPGSRRRAYRVRVLKRGKVVLTSWTAVACEIRDLSEDGARLEFRTPLKLPESFRLLIESPKSLRPVRLVWQRRLEAGVQFTGASETGSDGKLFVFTM